LLQLHNSTSDNDLSHNRNTHEANKLREGNEDR
jgi:hypothetical protein